jgi:hypothetical protein
MADVKKLLDHPEKQVIISKLASGETPKTVAQYLRNKYTKPDENHLRLPVALLKEFIDTYGDHYGFVKRIVKDDQDGKLDKQIADSLLSNKEWKDRMAEVTDEEIDFRMKWRQLLHMLEARMEQVFDKVQENPGSHKADYVMGKYFELWQTALERADKMINERPDVKIEHSYTVQMVEQQSVAFQEAIRRVLNKLDPALSNMFIDMLNEELRSMKPDDAPKRSLQKDKTQVNKLLDKAEVIETELDDEEDDEE